MRVVWMLQLLLVLLVPSGIYAHAHRQDPPRALRGRGAAAGVDPRRRHATSGRRPTGSSARARRSATDELMR